MHISRSEIKFVRNYSITEFSELLMTERFDIICELKRALYGIKCILRIF
jgi:hypothetical protein